jgi:hypothetical protein
MPENDLYPNEKRTRGGIWGCMVLIMLIAGLAIFFFWDFG